MRLAARARKSLAQALDWRFRAVITRLDALNAGVDELNTHVDALSAGVDALSARADALNSGVDALHARVDTLNARVDTLNARAEHTEGVLERRVEPMLRAVLDEEAENRRRLFAARASSAYEEPYLETHPLVSVTLPTQGRLEPLLTRALPSLLAQTYTNIEVVVVGDAASEELARELARVDDARVRYANLTQRTVADDDPRHQWLVGSTIPRNEAARLARGLWLLHFDDDDHLRPDAIESLLALARQERAEVAYGGFLIHHVDDEITIAQAFPPLPGQFGWQGALVHRGLGFFQRELVAGRLGIAGDMYLLERMLRVGVRFAMLDRIVWDYHPTTWRR